MNGPMNLKPVELDNDDVDALLSSIHGVPPAQAVQARLRYLRKIGFPPNAKAGRGKRTVHDLEGALKLAIVFEMLALGIPPGRAVATVTSSWEDLRGAVMAGWHSLKRHRSKLAGIGETRDDKSEHRDDQVEDWRRVIILDPRSLVATEMEPIRSEVATLASARLPLSGAASGLRAHALIDTFPLAAEVERALGEVLRYRPGEIAAAFSALAKKTREAPAPST